MFLHFSKVLANVLYYPIYGTMYKTKLPLFQEQRCNSSFFHAIDILSFEGYFKFTVLNSSNVMYNKTFTVNVSINTLKLPL